MSVIFLIATTDTLERSPTVDPQQAAYGICQPKITPVSLYSSSLSSFPHGDICPRHPLCLSHGVTVWMRLYTHKPPQGDPFSIHNQSFTHIRTRKPTCHGLLPKLPMITFTQFGSDSLFFLISCNSLIVQLHITRASMSSFTHGQAFRLALFSDTL